MHYPHDDLYHDRTWFDVLGDWLAQRLRRLLPRAGLSRWTVGFAAVAAFCVAWAAGLATQAVLSHSVWNQHAADLISAVLLLVAARHFLAVARASTATASKARTPVARTPPQVVMPPAAPAIACASTTPVPASPRPTPAEIAAAAQIFYRALRDAGINVRIAQSLYAAGFRNAARVRQCSDAQLLAIPGIGPATLRKLRLQFGPSRVDQSSSNAA